MKLIFEKFNIDEKIPAGKYLKNRKLEKYFNRETAAAIVCAGKILSNFDYNPKMPVYYGCERIEFEDYGLDTIIANSINEKNIFLQKSFINDAMPLVSPLNQFKVLYNMPVSFISIENNLTGDSAVIYHSGNSLIEQILSSNFESEILIGAGKVFNDGSIESAFALITVNEAKNIKLPEEISPIELLKLLQTTKF